MDRESLWQQFSVLSPNAKQRVTDLMARLAKQANGHKNQVETGSAAAADDPFVGISGLSLLPYP
ncbi:MAG: hypothetical protein QOF51_2630 [Chloroflexota bacterium]|jgi:hypothetical protein|nr:hypothetical protein [Chloroflexota bacterium]